eukprot:scaffold528209_cov24-Prasinocladus_malaysianus.AAC.1
MMRESSESSSYLDCLSKGCTLQMQPIHERKHGSGRLQFDVADMMQMQLSSPYLMCHLGFGL